MRSYALHVSIFYGDNGSRVVILNSLIFFIIVKCNTLITVILSFLLAALSWVMAFTHEPKVIGSISPVRQKHIGVV